MRLKDARKTYQYDGVGMGQLVLDDLDDGHDASTDLFCSVAVIIGAYPQYNNLDKTQ